MFPLVMNYKHNVPERKQQCQHTSRNKTGGVFKKTQTFQPNATCESKSSKKQTIKTFMRQLGKGEHKLSTSY